MDENNKNHKQVSLFEREIKKYIERIEGLYLLYEHFTSSFDVIFKQKDEKFQEFLVKNTKKIIHKTKDGKDEEFFSIPADRLPYAVKHIKQVNRLGISKEIYPRSFIINLICLFDAYLSDLIRVIFSIIPNKLNENEKEIKFCDLLKFENFDEVKEYVVEKEIETILRDNHKEQINWFRKKFSIEHIDKISNLNEFLEVTERRNLYVHNDGRISNLFINNCKNIGIDISAFKVGDTLTLDNNYCDKAFSILFEIGVKLGQIIWRQLKPEEITIADTLLTLISYDLIFDKRYDLAINILEFFPHYAKKSSSEEVKLMLIINKAQAYKWKGDNDKAQEIINNEDWSAKENKFKLARLVLLDEFPDAIILMKKIGNSDETLNKTAYKEWPLFQKFRLYKDFTSTYKEIFNEDFEETDLSKIEV